MTDAYLSLRPVLSSHKPGDCCLADSSDFCGFCRTHPTGDKLNNQAPSVAYRPRVASATIVSGPQSAKALAVLNIERLRCPLKIAYSIICRVCVDVVAYVSRFPWTYKCDAHKAVNSNKPCSSKTAKAYHRIAKLVDVWFEDAPWKSAHSDLSASVWYYSVKAFYSSKARNLVAWKSIDRTPFFARLIERHVRTPLRAGTGGVAGLPTPRTAASYLAFPAGASLA